MKGRNSPPRVSLDGTGPRRVAGPMPTVLLAAITVAALWLGAGFILLGLDWWRPSRFDILGYLLGGVLIFLPLILGLAHWLPLRRRRE